MVAIKDMEMPNCCISCKIGDNVPNCPCKGSTLIFDYQDKRHPDCPLVEIEERKQGKWIIDDEERGRIWHCHCSNCKKDPQDYIGGSENWWLVRLPDYCPKCGSRNER